MKNSTVKTTAKAEELVIQHANEIAPRGSIIMTKWVECECECGTTKCYESEIHHNNRVHALVRCGVCESCGDDDAFGVDVLIN